MPAAIDNLLSILDLEPLEHNLFRGRSPQVGWQRVFGGQVIGQALTAATRTVEPDRKAHSLHAYFLRPGDPSVPIIYEVDRIRDGKSFVTRRVVAIQHGHAIFSMSASFQVEEPGLEHQMPAPDVPPPEELVAEDVLKQMFMDSATEPMKAYWRRERPIELRPVSLRHYVGREKLEPVQHVWFRATGALPDDPGIHACVLAYASDMLLARHLALSARTLALRQGPAGGEPRPRAVDPPSVPRRRLAALFAGQPDRLGRARLQPRRHLQPRRRARGVGGAGGADPGVGGGRRVSRVGRVVAPWRCTVC